MKFNQALKNWNSYWFRPYPILNLGIARIAIVGFQLCLILFLRPYFHYLMSLTTQPESMYAPKVILRVLFLPFGSDFRPTADMIYVSYCVMIVSGFTSLIGFRTNFSLLVFTVTSVIIHGFKYSFGDIHHPDALMILALSILALSPSGATLSIDDLWKRKKQAYQAQKFRNFSFTDEVSGFALWPLLTIQWLFALIYFSSFHMKMYTTWGFDWMNGYTLQFYLFRDGMVFNVPFGVWASQFHFFAILSSIVAILFEGTFFLVLIFPILLWIYIPFGVLFHTGIYLLQAAPFFQYFAIYFVFINWIPLLHYFEKHRSTKKRTRILFDGQCPLCIKSITFIRYFDWFCRFNYDDLEEPDIKKDFSATEQEIMKREMHLITPDGRKFKGFFAFRKMLTQIPLLWPLLIIFYFPFASAIGPYIYNRVASTRKRFSRCPTGTCNIHQ